MEKKNSHVVWILGPLFGKSYKVRVTCFCLTSWKELKPPANGHVAGLEPISWPPVKPLDDITLNQYFTRSLVSTLQLSYSVLWPHTVAGEKRVCKLGGGQ